MGLPQGSPGRIVVAWGRGGLIAPLNRCWVVVWVIGAVCLPRAATADTWEGEARVEVADGMTVVLHSSPQVDLTWIRREEDGVWFRHPQAGEFELLAGPDDARLPRADVSSFVPLEPGAVLQALRSVTSGTPGLEVEVFLLPAPPARTLGSFARRNAIFLAPGFADVPDGTVAYLFAHELGHVLTWACIDPVPARWTRYLSLRGLDATANGPLAPHAERAREILAEDFRWLFGGAPARAGAGLENDALPLPDAVPGLREQLASWLAAGLPEPGVTLARAFPQPAARQVTVELVLPEPDVGAARADGEASVLEVFDLRGRLVRLVAGGLVVNGRLAIAWDGRSDGGEPVAAGRYAYRIRGAGQVGRGTLVILR